MYDLCQIIETVGSHEDRRRLFPQATKTTPGTSVLRGRYRFLDQEFSVQSVLGGGEYGRVMLGTFGSRDVVLKRNVKVSMREDVNEVIMQTRLYCYIRDHHDAASHMARIPETIFAAAVPGFGRVLGMERMDVPLLAHVQKTASSAQVRVVRDSLVKVCELLAVLQSKFSFMHGDLHGENVMVRGADEVFLIDFGMASAKFDRHPRTITSERYKGVPYHPHLDLLTLLTALREDLGLSKHKGVAAWCGALVHPFWTTVRTELLRDGGTSHTKLPYGARTTVRTARKEILSSGEVYYAHHLLYEDIGRVSYPPCEPRNMIRRLRATRTSPKRRLERERLFEDV
jgi:tRNA A-37 threonylcarbamoyl transferase component Bud32